jgi:regulator of sirC expression with transglutaminase-like and TPR domain
MTSFATRVTWEKLLLEIRNLQNEDCASLVPLMIGTNAIIAPKEAVETVFKKVHFLTFELTEASKDLALKERWHKLHRFFFEEKAFKILTSGWSDLCSQDLLLKPILETKAGHPLPMTLLFLHLALSIELPVSLVQARHQFILKFASADSVSYLDILQNGRLLAEDEVFQILQKSNGDKEPSDARAIYRRYLEELMYLYEQQMQPQILHSIYNLSLHLDESNLPVLGRRALLRQRLGFAREALADLKRYFSFVDRSHAPIELQKLMIQLEATAEAVIERPMSGPSDLLH